ncbi:CLUMA_CG006481, isoform A [Clunio marinus]|uniref:long-chain-fatty-acid--CoA ligase n=1 Tax=Clunio marinus TaxID=568069 RepID=A0A1J1I3Q2_9DIPT|nr:CLUMA_CG006481, isoform A [Clunio marinus]
MDNLIYAAISFFVAIVSILFITGKWRWFYIAAVTGPRDLTAVIRFIRLLLFVRKLGRKNTSICDLFEENCKKYPNKACLVFEGREWTFSEINDFKNRIANVFHQHGFKHGDKVALLMENRPEFVATWLGLSKLGVVVPLINHNLKKQSLLHSINIAGCNGLLFGESLLESVEDIYSQLPSNLVCFQFNDEINLPVYKNSKDLQTLLAQVSPDPPPNDKIKKPSHHDELVYIYTSGTTGLPKAAVITHSRYIYIASAIHIVADFWDKDVFYSPLPLYHTACGCMAIGQMLIFGSTVVIKKKFSASAFFSDCVKYNATIAQYIGEMCRYCLSTPGQQTDTTHNLRMVFGNGLRPQIWPQFVKRFNIPRVCEFYGATEGNANIVNVDNVVGAIGFVSRIIPAVYPISIIKCNPDTGEPIRDRNGLCQLCEPNEPGVFIGKIIPNNPSRAFLGYVDKSASNKKIVYDVFKKGDSAFISGDILTADERGNLFFVDRTGDTFRWKGENCSTSEIEAQVSNEAGYRDCVVYGVEIVNMEGRAGMAAISDPEKNLHLKTLSENLRKALPSYARPQLLRILEKIDMTGTCKLKKLDLQKEGFNPNVVNDKLYFLNAKNSEYELLTPEIYEKILNQEVRF